jgi:hypothetical protein
MKNSLRLIVIILFLGFLTDCTDKGPAGPEVTDGLTGAALESRAPREYWAADYWSPLVAQRYGLRTFEWTVGESGTFTSSILGTHTVPYTTGALTGTLILFGDDPLLMYVDRRSLYQLNADEYYVSTNCGLERYPPHRIIDRFVDGMILDFRGTDKRVHYADPDDCIPASDDGAVWLVQIRDVYVGGKKYKNAVLMWDLIPGSEHKTLRLGEKGQELGITPPSTVETNGWAIDGWIIVGFRQGIIAVGDFWVDTGELDSFAELVSIEPLVESVTGSGSRAAVEQAGDWRTFSFTAYRYADGTVKGQWERIRRQDGNAADSKSHGVVTCFTIVGDEAWLGGYATTGLGSDPPDNGVAWRVRDNGQGKNAGPDQISLQWTYARPNYPAWYCANTPDDPGQPDHFLALNEIEAGDIKIRP